MNVYDVQVLDAPVRSPAPNIAQLETSHTRAQLETRLRVHEMRIIAFANSKGGVGKTTSTINVGAAIANMGYRVLMIDLDPQANLTVSLGLEPARSTYEMLLEGSETADLGKYIQTTGNMSIIRARSDLAKAEIELSAVVGGEFRLDDALAVIPADTYDYVLLDCPPNLGMLTINALVAAREVMIPLQMEFLPLEGLTELVKTIKAIEKRYNPELTISGIIATFYNERKKINREVLAQVESFFGDRVFKTHIRDNVHLKEAPSHGKSIIDYKVDSAGGLDYLALAGEIVKLAPEDASA